MYCRTPMLRGIFSRSRRQDMQSLLENHFWGLTSYRIGRRFLGLDLAGNVIFFPSYRSKGFGGWSAVTMGAPGDAGGSFLSSDTSAVNVLEDGYPLHHKASRQLQQFVKLEKQKWDANFEKEVAARKKAAAAAAAAATGEAASAAAAAEAEQRLRESNSDYNSDQKFKDVIAIRFMNRRYFARQLRISRLGTFVYKCCYFYLWAVLLSLIAQAYLMFRHWVNPPAREGLRNIEGYVFHFPRVLFAAVASGAATAIRMAAPFIDSLASTLKSTFAPGEWANFSADSMASKADAMAQDARAATSAASGDGSRRTAVAGPAMGKDAEERRTWWTKVLMMLLALFSILCIL